MLGLGGLLDLALSLLYAFRIAKSPECGAIGQELDNLSREQFLALRARLRASCEVESDMDESLYDVLKWARDGVELAKRLLPKGQ